MSGRTSVLAVALSACGVGDGVPEPFDGAPGADEVAEDSTSGPSMDDDDTGSPSPPGGASSSGPGDEGTTAEPPVDSSGDEGSTGEPDGEDKDGWPPYRADSFWNTSIPDDAPAHPSSATMLARFSTHHPGNAQLSSDVTQNSYPLYEFDASASTSGVSVSNYFSYFENFDTNPDGDRVGAGFNPLIEGVPIPEGVMNGAGSDAQVLFWDRVAGVEWAFWQFDGSGGSYWATNGYRYDTLLGTGRTEGSGRGAGVSKLGGLVTAHEAEVLGEVEHAIAFAYGGPTSQWVYPATKSDGGASIGSDIPEGARIQLDPSLTDADFDALGLSPTAKAIARACQVYGLILVDGSGRPKAFLESDVTGDWSDVGAMEYVLAPLTEDGGGNPDWTVRWRVIDYDVWTGGPTGILGP